MDNNGWIKLHRCLIDKAIWACSTPEQKVVLITILLLANHEPKQWIWRGKKFEVQAGQFITSRENLARKAMVSQQSVRSALNKLKELEFLTYESTKTGTLITIVNWGLYQSREFETNQQANQEPTKSQPRANQEPTTNKNNKKSSAPKELQELLYTRSFEHVWEIYPRKDEKKRAYECYTARLNSGYSEEELLQATEAYAKECEERQTEKRYIKQAKTFFGINEPFVDYLKRAKIQEKKQDLSSFFDINEANNTPPYFGLPKEWFDGETLIESRVEPIWHPRMHGLPEGTESAKEVINTFNWRKRGWHEYNKRKGESSGSE